MKLSIENFAKIKRADIDLNGITIIAGENNRRCIADSLNKRIRFGLGIYEGFLFSKVRIFTIEEFEKYFVSKIDKLNQ